jgi:diacylglycerol O-acyltransferase-1
VARNAVLKTHPKKKIHKKTQQAPFPTHTLKQQTKKRRWNAATLGAYWRSWNLPVHKWVLRTVYFPALTRLGLSRHGAMLLTFFVSAVLHELAIGVPLRMVRGWAFWGIMFQVPLIALTEALRRRLKSDALGNLIFWLSFCVFGQPVAVLAYFHDYNYAKNAARAAAIARATAGPAAVGLLLPPVAAAAAAGGGGGGGGT